MKKGKMIIDKQQSDQANFALHWLYFDAARLGLKYILELEKKKRPKILLPAYIGFSSREGSGVFDPVQATKMQYEFYGLDKDLNVLLTDLTKKIKKNVGQILFLIHYFGFKDKNLDKIKRIARKNNMLVIEDFAHALFTFWQDAVVSFDYAIFSLHKLLPVAAGGLALSKSAFKGKQVESNYNFYNFDLAAIAQKRVGNYCFILRNLNKVAKVNGIVILRKKLGLAVPQTFPIMLPSRELRDYLYFELNQRGFGVISLYHELVAAIPRSYADEYDVAGRILNLPVHQDVTEKQLADLLSLMLKLIKKFKRIRR